MFDQMTREGRSVTGGTGPQQSPPAPPNTLPGPAKVVQSADPAAVLDSSAPAPESKPMGVPKIAASPGDGTNKNDGSLGLTGGFPVDPVPSPPSKGRNSGQDQNFVGAPPRSGFNPSVFGAVPGQVSSPTKRK
jgi:hypothetical protein